MLGLGFRTNNVTIGITVEDTDDNLQAFVSLVQSRRKRLDVDTLFTIDDSFVLWTEKPDHMTILFDVEEDIFIFSCNGVDVIYTRQMLCNFLGVNND